MLFLQQRKKQNVVHISYKATTQERANCVINHPLKNCRSILQPKWHSCVLEHPKLTLKHRVGTTTVYDGNLVESILKVNLEVNFSSKDGGNNIVQEGEGVIISLSDVVWSSIIYTDT